jgi:hypothetical protein
MDGWYPAITTDDIDINRLPEAISIRWSQPDRC